MSSPPAPSLTTAKATLLGLHLASTLDLPRLRALLPQHPSLSGPTLLRLLLALPESAEPAAYKPLIDHVLHSTALPVSAPETAAVDTSVVDALSSTQAQHKLKQLLPALAEDGNAVENFLVARACAIDAETGLLTRAAELLEPYTAELPGVARFYSGTLQVLRRVVYEFRREPAPSLGQFRDMAVAEALEVLVVDPETVVRDLEELVQPYLAARDDKENWKLVFARVGSLPFLKIVEVVMQWTPPGEVHSEFARWVLATCYRCRESGERICDGMRVMHRRLVGLLGEELEEGELPEKMGDIADAGNPLFRPTKTTLQFFDAMVRAASMLAANIATVAYTRLEGSKESQMEMLRSYVRTGEQQRSDTDWRGIREGVLWLLHGAQVLSKLDIPEVEEVLLGGLLSGAHFALVKELYVPGPLPQETVEQYVLDAFSTFFDAASNGNRTRGKMLNAYNCIHILYPDVSKSEPLVRAHRLITASQTLSTFSLTLTPSVPLRPVQIRLHPDPVSLITRLLDQNPRSYQQPEVLVTVAQDLAFSTSTTPPDPTDIEARVLGMATEQALAESDFEMAYSLLTSRLMPLADSNEAARETLWRTAFAAGSYVSPYAPLGAAPAKGPRALTLLEKKMELLALATRFAPVDAVADVLGRWERCEEELVEALEAEQRAEEEHANLAGGPRRMSGLESDGPQSLFEVARGAARVFGSGVGRGAAAGGSGLGGMMGGLGGIAGGLGGMAGIAGKAGSDSGDGEKAHHGRKRDVVAGVVTQGLASGLGWVLGAQPRTQ